MIAPYVIHSSCCTSCVHGTSVVVVTAACLCITEGCQAVCKDIPYMQYNKHTSCMSKRSGSNTICLWQFAGLFAVLVTAVGCLYLIDTSNSTETSKGRKAAVNADGVLLMLINVAFIAWMVGLVIKAGRHEVKKTVLSLVSWVQDKLSSLVPKGPNRGGRRTGRDMTLVPARSNAALLELQWSNTLSSSAIAYEQSNA